MRLLLDTHIVLWVLANSPRLPDEARGLIRDCEISYVSAATVWEIAIKTARGKLGVDTVELTVDLAAATLHDLPITWAHALAVKRLPPLHNDPFDRLLVAQAMTEPLILLTVDADLEQYGSLVRRV